MVAADLTAARAILAVQEVQLVLCDVELDGESGLDLVRWLQIEHPSVAAVMVTAVDDARFAESALGLGAYGYIKNLVTLAGGGLVPVERPWDNEC